MTSRAVGVVGAGVMGRGVAQNLAQAGASVVLVDRTEAALESARAEVRKSLRLFKLLAPKSALGSDAAVVLSRIRFTTDLGALADAGYVIENVTEKWEAKAGIYPQLDEICPKDAVFAANTSCFPITRIGSLTGRPPRVVGIHFMNPVPLKSVVEVVRGHHTSEATLTTTRELLASMGKEAIVVNDSPGFVSNRVLMLTINEAIFTVFESIAPAADVDRIFTSCFGHKMGPLETADLIGLDTILFSLEVLHESFADPKFRPCPLLRRMVDAGLHGRKSGKGFYEYDSADG